MNTTEEEIYNEIIDILESNKRLNEYLLSLYKGDIDRFKSSQHYNKEYTYLDYLDGRRNLIEIPNFCRYTGKKISKNIIKKKLMLIYDVKEV